MSSAGDCGTGFQPVKNMARMAMLLSVKYGFVGIVVYRQRYVNIIVLSFEL